MSELSRKLPGPPSFSFDINGAIKHVLPTLGARQLPWVPFAKRHRHKGDPSIFAAFVAIDRRLGRVWIIRGLLATNGGPVVLRQVTIDAFDEDISPLEIAAADVRDVRLGAIRDAAVANLLLQGKVAASNAGPQMYRLPSARKNALKAAGRAGEGRRGGRPSLTNEHHERVARLYIELFNAGKRRGILDELGRRLGKRSRPMPRETVRDWVFRSREAGFLAETKQGRAYGAPGPRLIALDKRRRMEEDNG